MRDGKLCGGNSLQAEKLCRGSENAQLQNLLENHLPSQQSATHRREVFAHFRHLRLKIATE